MRSRRLVVLVFLVAVVGADTLLAQRAQSAQSPPVQGSWVVVPSPNTGPEAGGNTLLAIDAFSATDAWAVGFHYNNPNYCTYCPAALALHWNGTRWSAVETPTIAQPKVQLTAVAAVASDDVWAVGHWLNDTSLSAGTLIEHWNGTSWSVVSSPNPGMFNALYGVAAVSSDDIWAVGDKWLSWSQKVPLILHYDGKAWTEIDYPPIDSGDLNSVFALAADDVWAVGVQGVLSTGIQGLALHWNGTSWTQAPIPSEPGGYIALYSVSGAASNDVWAVGVYKAANWNGQYLSWARAFHWNGSTWTKILWPGFGGWDSRIYDVHAIASDDVWSVGGRSGEPGSGVAFEYTTAHWDGISWSTVDTPNQGVMYSISASSSSDAWAVGFGMDALAYSTGTYTLRYTVGSGSADITSDGMVGVNDLLAVIGAWGPCLAPPAPCLADIAPQGAPDGVVDVNDLLRVIANWSA